MQVQGLCRICSRPGVLQTCSLCGSTVCERHIDGRSRVCVQCQGGSTQQPSA